jgi:hypothetical protein
MKLQRYNEVLFAVVATGALLLGLTGIASSWWLSRDRDRDPAGVQLEQPGPATASAPVRQQTLEFCEPQVVGGTPFEYFPVGVVDQLYADRDPKVAGDYGFAAMMVSSENHVPTTGCYGDSARRVTNVVIQNHAQGSERLLLDKPGLIDSMSLPDTDCAKGEGRVPCGIAIWMLRSEDSNGDGKLNALDVLSTWVSDLNGERLRRLTPQGQSTEDVHWFTDSNRLVIRVRPDTNGNEKYTDEDGIRLLVTSATEPSMATEAIGAATLEKLQQAIR